MKYGVLLAAVLLLSACSVSQESAPVETALVETVDTPEKTESPIVITTPAPNQALSNVFQVSGKARGFWFFEAVLPINIIDKEGHILLETFIRTEAEWMTEDFVPFSGEITLPENMTATEGFVVIQKNNPSDKRELDDEVQIPVVFK